MGVERTYTLIRTAEANAFERYAYLRHVFTELPRAKGVEDIEGLVPSQELAAQLVSAWR